VRHSETRHEGNGTHHDTFPFRQVCRRIAAFTALTKEDTMKKLAIASFAVLILGSSAALAEPYARHYASDQQACRNPDRGYDYREFSTGHMENVPVCLGDPATGMHVTAQEYLSKYPWSDKTTWVYNPAMDVWADKTPDKDRLYAQSNTQGDRRYSRNYSPDYRSNYSQDYRYRYR
jgi:hypothetical protein